MFGDSLLDYLTDAEILQKSEAAQRVIMQRRKEHCEKMEKDWLVVVIGDRRPGLGYHVRGVVLVRKDGHLQTNLDCIYDVVNKNTFDCTTATELRHMGFPTLDYTDVDKNNPCTLLGHNRLGSLSPGESGRFSTRYPFSMDGSYPPSKGSMKSDQPSVQSLPKGFDPTLAGNKGWPTPAHVAFNAEFIPDAADYSAEQVFLCQHCGKDYKYGDSTAELKMAFCTGLCETQYRLDHNGEFPRVIAEIPLKEVGACYLGSMRPNDEVIQKYLAAGQVTQTPVLNEQQTAALAGMTVSGAFTLPGGVKIPAPRVGYCWRIAAGKIWEEPEK